MVVEEMCCGFQAGTFRALAALFRQTVLKETRNYREGHKE